eukprot:TRINITY_DN1051_c0_g2_i1.p4 TRINITY_DN1051_c0_g2~~TRINITY_DN1051_c0_g2_i1.p4  ORF type:complete len:567 (-),score=99.98 TRINITY_DN1051_c0_g2_i1:80-1780(-)
MRSEEEVKPAAEELPEPSKSLILRPFHMAYVFLFAYSQGYANSAYTYFMDPITYRLKGAHEYLIQKDKEDTGFAEKKVKQAYGVALGLVQRSAELLQNATGKVGTWRDKVVEQLVLLETQLKVLYQESLWMIHENYIMSLQVMNHYVIFARAFYDSYAIATHEKKELVFSAYLEQVRALSIIAGMPLTEDDEVRARSFFDEAKTLWEGKLLTLDDKSNESKELLETLKKAVALQLGKFNKAVGLGFYDAYEQLAQLSAEFSLEDYINECQRIIGNQWKDEYMMRRLAAEYYVYNKWRIEELNNDYLKRYASEHTRLMVVRKLLERTLELAIERYLKFYEYLVGIYYDESVENYAKAKGREYKDLKALEGKLERLKVLNMRAMDIFGFYGNEVKNFVQESRLYQCAASTLRLDVPLEFAKTNALRLFRFGGVLVKKFREGMTVVYDKGSHTVTVVLETVKNPAELKNQLTAQFKNLKSVVAGYYLMLDFDADGWVSMGDFWNSMGKLYKILRQMDYIGEGKVLYMRALGYLTLAKRDVKREVEKAEVKAREEEEEPKSAQIIDERIQ